MNILKAIIGMGKWKKAMKKLANEKAYTPEWWKACETCIEFLPEKERVGFLDSFVSAMLGF